MLLSKIEAGCGQKMPLKTLNPPSISGDNHRCVAPRYTRKCGSYLVKGDERTLINTKRKNTSLQKLLTSVFLFECSCAAVCRHKNRSFGLVRPNLQDSRMRNA